MSKKSPFHFGSGTNSRFHLPQDKPRDHKETNVRPLSQSSDNDFENFSDSDAGSLKSFDLESVSQASSNLTPRSSSPASTASGSNVHSPLPYSFNADFFDLLGSQSSLRSPTTSLIEFSMAGLPAESDMRQTLMKIREQMAKSLLRLKDLEEQVKSVPTLQVRISVLQEEKRQLLKQLQSKSTQRKNRKKDFSVYNSFRQRGCISDTENDEEDDEYAAIRKKLRLKLNSRSIGVGNSSVNDSLCDCLQTVNSNKSSSYVSVGVNVSVESKEQSCQAEMVQPKQDCGMAINCKPIAQPVRTRSIGVGMMRSFTKDTAVGGDVAIRYTETKAVQSVVEMHTSSCDPMFIDVRDVAVNVEPTVTSVEVTADIKDADNHESVHKPACTCSYPSASVGSQTVSCSPTVSVGTGVCTIDKESCERCKRHEHRRATRPVDEILANNIELPTCKSTGVGNTSISDDYFCDRCGSLETRSIGVGEYITTADQGSCDQSVSDIQFDRHANLQTKSRGVGDFPVHQVICDNCVNRKTKSQGVGSFRITDTFCDKCSNIKTKAVGVGNLSVTDIFCDKCLNIKTKSVGTNCVTPTVTVGVSECCISDNYCDRCLHIKTRTVAVGDCCVTDSFCERCFNVQMKSVAVGDFDVNKELCHSTENTCIPTLKSLSNDADSNDNYSGINGNLSHSDLASFISKKYIEQDKNGRLDRMIVLQNGISNSAESDSSIDQDNPSSDSASQVSDVTDVTGSIQHARIEEPVIVACKLLNGHLYKGKEIGREQMVSCMATIESHWIQLISSRGCSAHLMKSYIKNFDHQIPLLLETIVNLTDKNGNNALHYAVSFRNYAVVELLLNTGLVNVDLTNKAGYSTLMMFALTGANRDEDMNAARRLLEAGNVNKRVLETGQTPLMLAVSRGRLDTVELLLDTGAEINAVDDDGSTALMCACEHGHTDIARRLLAQPGCNSALADNDGSTAISIAMERKFKDIALLIYGHGSLPRLRRTKSSTVV